MPEISKTERPVGRRLDGWKEIAGHLNRGVRTVQRWEKDYGLPIQRLGHGKSEAVFAFTNEIDEWLVTAAAEEAWLDATKDVASDSAQDSEADGPEAEPPSDAVEASRLVTPWWRHPATWICVALVALGVAGWFVWGSLRKHTAAPVTTAAHASNPAAWRIDVDTLVVTNDSGAELWRHRFSQPLNAAVYAGTSRLSMASIQDFDADGRRELLFVEVPSSGPFRRPLHRFESDGTLRWTYRYEGSVQFGQEEFSSPFGVYGFTTTPDPDGAPRTALWVVSIHNTWFPSLLQRVNLRTGTASTSYWSNGFINTVVLGRAGGRPVLYVGASNNETKSASIAEIDALNPNGSAPAANAKYRCRTCQATSPLAFVVLPKPARFKELDTSSACDVIDVQDAGNVLVRVTHAGLRDEPQAVAVYKLNEGLAPVSADTADRYMVAYRVLVEKKLISNRYPTLGNPEDELLPLLRWNGTGYSPVGKNNQQH